MKSIKIKGLYDREDFSKSDITEHDIIIRTMTAMVDPLAAIISGNCEVVLHDIWKLPNSIVAINGTLTGRSVGGLATDMLLETAVQNRLKTRVGYVGHGLGNKELRCATIVVSTSAGTPVAALCFNSDTLIWRKTAELVSSMMPMIGHIASTDIVSDIERDNNNSEHFVNDIDDLVEDLLLRGIDKVGIPIDLMKKQHKLSVVAELKLSGFFILRGSVERAADALGVTRYTIYNYLKELEAPEV